MAGDTLRLEADRVRRLVPRDRQPLLRRPAVRPGDEVEQVGEALKAGRLVERFAGSL